MLQVRVVQVAYGDDESVEQRVTRVAQLVRQQQDADLIVLPELWSHGGFAHSAWRARAEPLTGPTVAALSAAVRETGAVVHIGSLVERVASGSSPGPEGRGLWNTSVVLGPDGQIRATYRKVHRFGFGEGEPVLLEAGEEIVTSELTGRRGGGVTLGLATCYDLRFPEMFRALLDAGSEVFVVPAAWPLARVEHWQLLGRARALENQCFVIQCNTAGTHSGVAMGGNSQVVGPDGAVLARAGVGEEVLSVALDLAELEDFRSSFPVLGDRRLLPSSGHDS
ncbi:carbon-nitrogen family hydrolase [Geodermatophilus ruber]|uniref:Carbon-nitrogen hydrolase n=1 Tax=Geodermatophilus ruber TaxID=504800 RepID=A0A1I4G4V8_9ACTN|nr:carbon-nitrogen family hydrolase [Geodermatophilus ruber]SFL24116.1 Carbon-nitrogen hydrolase [Geodermatophilus ruber]